MIQHPMSFSKGDHVYIVDNRGSNERITGLEHGAHGVVVEFDPFDDDLQYLVTCDGVGKYWLPISVLRSYVIFSDTADDAFSEL